MITSNGDSMLGSDNWERYRPELQKDWYAEQEAHGSAVESRQPPNSVVEDVSMDEVEPSPM
jgi:hypothetical protein